MSNLLVALTSFGLCCLISAGTTSAVAGLSRRLALCNCRMEAAAAGLTDTHCLNRR